MGKKKKQKVSVVTTISSFDEIDNKLLALGMAVTEKTRLESLMDNELQKIREGYQERLSKQDEVITATTNDIEAFCKLNAEEFEEKRSREFLHGIIGMRKDPPSVNLLNRKYNWKTVLELLSKVKWGKDYIRTKQEVDKETILANATGEKPVLPDDKLAAVGLRIEQEDRVFVEPKLESTK